MTFQNLSLDIQGENFHSLPREKNENSLPGGTEVSMDFNWQHTAGPWRQKVIFNLQRHLRAPTESWDSNKFNGVKRIIGCCTKMAIIALSQNDDRIFLTCVLRKSDRSPLRSGGHLFFAFLQIWTWFLQIFANFVAYSMQLFTGVILRYDTPLWDL